MSKRLWIYSLAIMGFVFILMNGCKKDESDNVAIVGGSYQGGIVAYIFVVGDPGYVAGEIHGLIAAPSDQSAGIQWYNRSETVTGATATALGAGKNNTLAIINLMGNGDYAAKLCSDLVLGGYDDWFLPSKDELSKLYLNRVAIGGFANAFYWSSSEMDDIYAWMMAFNDGLQTWDPKGTSIHNVRAVRAF